MLIIKPKFNKFNKFQEKSDESILNQSIFGQKGDNSLAEKRTQQSGSISSEQENYQIGNKEQRESSKKVEKQSEIVNLGEATDEEILIQEQYIKQSQRKILGNGKQNIFINSSQSKYEVLTVQQIKEINKGHNCADFIFCSQIPMMNPTIKNKSINVDELDRLAEHFDLLFFKNKTAISKMQRFFTKSNYDHVAMVVKIQENRYILQSSGNHGVSLSHFSKFITNLKSRTNPQSGYEVGYRKFIETNIDSNQKYVIMKNSQEFIRKAVGKKYKFSPMYLMSADYKKKQETYFCSELIAELLVHCGLLKLSIPTYSIFPKDLVGKKYQNQDVDMEILATSPNRDEDITRDIYQRIKPVKIKAKKQYSR